MRCHCGHLNMTTLHFSRMLGKQKALAWNQRLLVLYVEVYLSSKIRIAAAIVVVQRPFLSPTADCVTFAVRTILSDIR